MSRPLALVTGASRGIGRAVALALSPTHHVLVGGRDRDLVDEVVGELESAAPFVADLTDEAAVAAAVAGMDEAVQSWRVSIRYLWQNRARRRPGRQARRTSERPHDIKMRDETSSAAAKGGRIKGGNSRC